MLLRLNFSQKVKRVQKGFLSRMSDYLLNAPEVVFERIYRKCNLPTQLAVFSAYRKEEYAPGLDRVLGHQQFVYCWCCMSDIFWQMFGGTGGRDTRDFTSMMFREEPPLLSEGLKILFKSAGEHNDKKYFVQRDFKNPKDMEESDKIFATFHKRISEVFKAKDMSTLKAHLDSEHRRKKYMPRNFFRRIRFEIGKRQSIFAQIKIIK